MKRPFSIKQKAILNFDVAQSGMQYCNKYLDIVDILILDYVKSRSLFCAVLDCKDKDALSVFNKDDNLYFELNDVEFCHYYPICGDFTTFWERVQKLCDEKLLVCVLDNSGKTVYRVSGLYEDVFVKGERTC